MGKQVVKGGFALFGGQDLTPDINSVALSQGADAEETTNLLSDGHEYTPGLKTVKASVKGFWDADDDAVIFAKIGGKDLLSLAVAQVEGGIGYFAEQMPAQYQIGDQVGKVIPMSLTVSASGSLIRGTILARKSTISASGHGTGFQLGSVGADQSIYAALHVTDIEGTGVTITGILESSADDTFGSPTTRITFADVTDVTGVMAQLLALAGSVTDTWWRFKFTISGTGTFDFTALAGIQ